MNVISYLPVEKLDDLIKATGFDLDDLAYEYKYNWLLERIKIWKELTEKINIVHDAPEIKDVVSLLQQERRYSDGQAQTIIALQTEIENLRTKIKNL